MDDLQLADEHNSLMVSSDIRAISDQDVLTEQLEKFHWHWHETIGANFKMLILVTIYGFILIISWIVDSGICEISKFIDVFKHHCPQLGYCSSLPVAPKARFRSILHLLSIKSQSVIPLFFVISSEGSFGGKSF